MSDISLVPVDHQPDFEDASLVPVDHDPFSADGVTQQAQAQQVRAQTEPAQPEQHGQPLQPATGADQPDVTGPATGYGGSGGGAGGSNAGRDPNNPASDQGGAEPLPFAGYANPTPAESLVNKAQMDDLAAEIDADPTRKRGSYFEGGNFVQVCNFKARAFSLPDRGYWHLVYSNQSVPCTRRHPHGDH